jgi:hypothetical protein
MAFRIHIFLQHIAALIEYGLNSKSFLEQKPPLYNTKKSYIFIFLQHIAALIEYGLNVKSFLKQKAPLNI